MGKKSFTEICITETIEGLADGLSRFSGQSRAALIYAVSPNDPIRIYDPQNLLRGHEPKFEEIYLKNKQWIKNTSISYDRKKFSNMTPLENLQLAGLISYGGRSSSVFYQMWFTEHHPNMCSVGPTERWLEQAAWRFSHDIANDEDLYTGISGNFLREYATHAVRDYLVDEMNVILGWDTKLRIYPILESVIEISRTPEEGAWPKGQLVFIEKRTLPKINFIVKFPKLEKPSLEHYKHIRKLLLAVEFSDRKLVADEKTIIGITDDSITDFHITADFRGRHGFLHLNENKVCSFSEGSYKSTTRKAILVQIEEALLESEMPLSSVTKLFQIVTYIVNEAGNQKHGCTIVIDLNKTPISISGQKLEKPLDIEKPSILELTKSLSKVDGALHIGSDLHLHGFACLLDGHCIQGEDRARGARFNSALRFSAEHKNIIVVVVSSDKPVSVIQEGAEMDATCQWKPEISYILPSPLEKWIKKAT